MSKLFLPRAAELVAAIAVLSSVAAAQAKAPGYHVIHRITTGGEGGWDYLTIDTTSNPLSLA
jgi:hypothetical protein